MHSKSWIFGSSETIQPVGSGGLHPRPPASESTIETNPILVKHPIPKTSTDM